jgi:hypothetical protein
MGTPTPTPRCKQSLELGGLRVVIPGDQGIPAYCVGGKFVSGVSIILGQ